MLREADAVLTQAWQMWKSGSRVESVIAIGMVLGLVFLAFRQEIVRVVRGAI